MDRLKAELGMVGQDMLAWLQGLWGWIHTHPSILAVTIVMALPAAIFWIWMYERRVAMDRAHRRLMLRTFLIGMGSVLPVLWVNYVLVHFLGFDTNYFITQKAAIKAYGWVFFAFMIVGINEEFAKHLIVREVDYRRREFNRIADGVEFSIAAALGFAFIENITYFVMAMNLYHVISPQFAQVVVFRSLGSMLAHTIFSGFYGYYYGRARFSGTRTDDKKPLWNFSIQRGVMLRAKRLKNLLLWRKNIHLEKDLAGRLREEELIAEGLFVAMALHAIYDFLLQYNLVWATIPLIAIEYLIIVHELHVHRNLDTYLFSLGGTTIVSRVSENGDLEIEDPEVRGMLERWDEYGNKLAKLKGGGHHEHTDWKGHPEEEAASQELTKNRQ